MTDILCVLAGHGIISIEVAAGMAGMDWKNFEKTLMDWQYGLMED